MNLRFVATPLAAPVGWPAPRGRVDPATLAPAFVRAAGDEAVHARLARPDALVVTTGQQPALFTGPLYTITKALSAAALARVLERRWGRPVVPVFWSAGDDHDFAEGNHASWLRDDGTLGGAVLRTRAADAPLTPLAREPLGVEVEAARAALEAELPAGEFRAWTAAWLARHFRPEVTIGAASAGALAELLAPLGIAVLDGAHPALKAAARPVLRRALEGAAPLDERLATAAVALRAEGHDPGVAVGDGATLVMLEGREGRDRLVRTQGAFVTRRGRERFTPPELLALLEADPARFSANVLLRPVVESAILPTVAYVAGPGELRYLALAQVLYAELGVPRQRPVPRWSGLLVEPRVDRALAKFGISLADLGGPPGALESRLVRAQLPAAITETLAHLRHEMGAAFQALEAEAGRLDPTLVRPAQGAGRRAAQAADRIEEKLVRHLKRRSGEELGQLARLRAAIAPGGEPQERVLTVAPFLARHGPDLLAALADTITDWYGQALEGAPVAS